MRLRLMVLFGCSLCLFFGCAEQTLPPPPPPVMTAETENQIAAQPAKESSEFRIAGERQSFDGLKFAVPEGWSQMPLSEMQRGIISAKFSMPKAGDEVTLTLSRSGGGVDANLDRWRGQFSSSRPEISDTITVAGVDSTLIDLEGRFAGGFGSSAQDGWRMLGVIVPLSDQGYFMKLTGPVDQVSAVEQEFRSFAKSATKE